MVTRVHGAATAMQNLVESIQYYKVFTLSPGSMVDPITATGVNIFATGNIADECQKNFEVLIQAIGLRAMPVVMGEPIAVSNVSAAGATQIAGEGYAWKFAIERDVYFKNDGPTGTISDVGHLVDELNGIVLPSAAVLVTTGLPQNIEFAVTEF